MPPYFTTSLAALPPDLVSLALVQTVLPSLMVAHTFLIPLLPLMIALFYYSTPHTRRQPIFVLNILSLTLTLCIGTIAETLGAHMILSPEDMWPQELYIAIVITGIFQSLLVDVILLLRLISVYPLRHVGIRKFALLTGLPIILKFVRVINVLLCTNALMMVIPYGNAMQAWLTLPYVRVEWVAQVVDNSYASIVFLWTIQDRGLRNENSLDDNVGPDQRTLTQTLRTLFRIALSNFIIPTVFSIAQLIILFVHPQSSWLINLPYVNGMLSVYGVVFASVWVGKESRRKAKEAKQSSISGSVNRSRSWSRSRIKRSNSAFNRLESFKAATRPTLVSVCVTETVAVDYRPGDRWSTTVPDKDKRVAEVEEGHEIALLPRAKRDSNNILPI